MKILLALAAFGLAAPLDEVQFDETSDETLAIEEGTQTEPRELTLDLVSVKRRSDLLCAVVAQRITSNPKKARLAKEAGMDQTRANTLARELAEQLLMEATYNQEETLRLLALEEEEFDSMLAFGSPAEAEKWFAEDVTLCKPLFDTISVEGEGSVGGLAPIELVVWPGLTNTEACHAIIENLVIATRYRDPMRQKFRDMLVPLKARYEAERGRYVAIESALYEVFKRFDSDAFEALPEEIAQPRMQYCFDLAAAPLPSG